jgi:hypothetical protein
MKLIELADDLRSIRWLVGSTLGGASFFPLPQMNLTFFIRDCFEMDHNGVQTTKKKTILMRKYIMSKYL